MDLKTALQLVITDTREVSDPNLSDDEALDLARTQTYDDVSNGCDDHELKTAYVLVLQADEGDLAAARA